MTDVASTAALALAVVFAWAGASKLVRQDQTAASFRGLGLPVPGVLARLAPAAELAIAGGLVLAPRQAAIAAIALLAVFSAVLGRAIRAGAAVPCACFGSARTEPVSGADIVRNLFLAGLGALALGTSRIVVPSLASVVLITTTMLTTAVVFALLGLWGRRSEG